MAPNHSSLSLNSRQDEGVGLQRPILSQGQVSVRVHDDIWVVVRAAGPQRPRARHPVSGHSCLHRKPRGLHRPWLSGGPILVIPY